MRKFNAQIMGVDEGNELVFADFKSGGEMWTGEGEREKRLAVTFSEPFRTAPVVQVAPSLWDWDGGTNARAQVLAENVTEKGFDLVVRTWSDSRIARMQLSWIAIGETRHADDWQL
jgi:hypothetical protein